jgi:glycosyltransferase 2 family protein
MKVWNCLMGGYSRSFFIRILRIVLGLTVSGLSLYLAVRNVEYKDVIRVLRHANIWFICLSLTSVALNILGKALRWQVLMGKHGQEVPFRVILGVLLIGQMLNTLIPARVGDISRAYMLGRVGLSRIFILGTVALEKILDMLSYVFLFLLLIILMPVPGWVRQPVYPFVIIAMSVFLTTLLLVRRQKWLIQSDFWMKKWLRWNISERITIRIKNGLASLSILQDYKNNIRLGLLSVIVWSTAVLTNYLVMRALALDIPSIAALFLLIVLQAGISIPSVPGQIGVFEYLCVLALGVFAIDSTTALSYGVLLHMIVLLPIIISSILFLWGTEFNLRYAMIGVSDGNVATVPLVEQSTER